MKWLEIVLIVVVFSVGCDEPDVQLAGDSGASATVPDAGAGGAFAAGQSSIDGGGLSSNADPSGMGAPATGEVGGGPAEVSPATPTSKPTISNVIESVGFTRSSYGAPYPRLLFQGGYAGGKIEQIVKPIDIAYDMLENPQFWTEWRRGAEGIEFKYTDGWEPLFYQYECRSLPKGTTLAGSFEYRYYDVIANAASFATVDRFHFAQDGTFQRCTVDETIIPRTGKFDTIAIRAAGKYEIDGYKITFLYSDGTSATLPFFFDPTRPTRLWVETDFYPNPTKDIDLLCGRP